MKKAAKTRRQPTGDSQISTGAPAPTLLPLYGDGGWREANKHLFASDWSLRWFIRQHKEELLLSGAVIELGGRLFADVAHFERLVREIGARTLQERMARDQEQINGARRTPAPAA